MKVYVFVLVMVISFCGASFCSASAQAPGGEFLLSVSDASAVNVYLGDDIYAYGYKVNGLRAGQQVVAFSATAPILQIEAAEGYRIVRACYSGCGADMADISYAPAQNFYCIDLAACGVEAVSVEAAAAVPGMVDAWVYCQGLEALAGYSITGSDGGAIFASGGTRLCNGYQCVALNERHNPVTLRLEYAGEAAGEVYLNGEPLPGISIEGNVAEAQLSISSGAVLKIFGDGLPAVYGVTFICEAEATFVVVDKTMQIWPFGTYQLFEGTEVEVSTAAQVSVNDAIIKPQGCKHTFAVDGEAWVTITPTAALAPITADPLKDKIFNLQGVEVSRASLRPGLYIVGGILYRLP